MTKQDQIEADGNRAVYLREQRRVQSKAEITRIAKRESRRVIAMRKPGRLPDEAYIQPKKAG